MKTEQAIVFKRVTHPGHMTYIAPISDGLSSLILPFNKSQPAFEFGEPVDDFKPINFGYDIGDESYELADILKPPLAALIKMPSLSGIASIKSVIERGCQISDDLFGEFTPAHNTARDLATLDVKSPDFLRETFSLSMMWQTQLNCCSDDAQSDKECELLHLALQILILLDATLIEAYREHGDGAFSQESFNLVDYRILEAAAPSPKPATSSQFSPLREIGQA